MYVIALVGNKGGAGKTTLAINLASMLNQLGPAILLDADPQGSSLQWCGIAGDAATLPVREAADSVADTANAISDAAYCVIDCPPSVKSTQTQQALRVCDLALVPVQPSPLDLWASVHIEEEVRQARIVNERLNALLVLNQLEPWTRLSKQVRDALAELSLPAAKTAIRRSVVHRSAMLQGRSVFEMGRRGKTAANEIRQLIEEFGIGRGMRE